MMAAMASSPGKIALVAFGVFLLGNLALGERFPFSRYDMYAGAGGLTQGGVPVFRAAGRPADVRDYEAFAGIDPDALLPAHVTTSMGHVVHDAGRWIAARRAPGGDSGPGAVEVEFGYRVIRVVDGRLRESWHSVARGTARRR